MRSWWDNKPWIVGSIGEQKFCTVRDKNSIKVFNITLYPIFSKLKNILLKIHLLLTRDKEHGKAFENIPIIGFKKGKSLKDIMVKAKVPTLKTV